MSIVVDNVSIRSGGRTVLKGISCSFPPNTLSALIGPSGTGKTTLLSAIAGMSTLVSGRVLIDGSPAQPTQTVWVPQGANALGSRTVLENVMIAPLSDGRSRIDSVNIAIEKLDSVNLLGRIDDPAHVLSGGELQRLAFARALASSRPIVLADEPTANLDVKSTRGVISILKSMRRDRSMVVATHDPEVIESADYVVDLKSLISDDE